jgi:hypothetical protein
LILEEAGAEVLTETPFTPFFKGVIAAPEAELSGDRYTTLIFFS